MAQASIRKLGFLGNRCVDPGKILWAASYSPHLQTVSFFFQKIFNFQIFAIFFFFFVIMGGGDPIGAKISRRYLLIPPTSFIRSQPNFMINKVVMGE